MKALQNIFSTPKKNFKVTKNDINNNKALLPNVLYQQMEGFVWSLLSNQEDMINETPKLFKLKLLKNAYLDDKLQLNAEVIALKNQELNLLVLVNKESKNNESIICKAIFKLQLKETISKAS
ncbi:MAG: hypothetical protein R3342_02260 [Lutibacter sp.]|uniref:hypothetical protein n=1 Tax=Lutibacter sp. TaxID=1925666 RepID=UPI00299D21BF|nr:hypothetical protein [Lutibacter sp.]MDX1828348.1 hypothetical protein [Lutibacter sp.]